MSHAQQASKRKRRTKVVPVLGAAGLSLSLVSGASAGIGMSAADTPARHSAMSNEITLGEEEVSGVSLATFYIFDKENARTVTPRVRFAGCGCGCGGCGGCAGCVTSTVSSPPTFSPTPNPPHRSIRPARKHTRKR
jgi:hypothetical protein